jgi:hypothetical protein
MVMMLMTVSGNVEPITPRSRANADVDSQHFPTAKLHQAPDANADSADHNRGCYATLGARTR